MSGDAGAGLLALVGSLQQKLTHPAGSQTLHQIEKWTVLESPAATAVFFPAGQELFDVGGSKKSGRCMDLSQEAGLSFLQAAYRDLLQIESLNHNNS